MQIEGIPIELHDERHSIRRLPESVRMKFFWRADMRKRWPDIDDIALYDAAAPIAVHIIRDDVMAAVPNDPTDCAMVRSCLRSLDAVAAWVGFGASYLCYKLRDRVVVVRFQTPPSVAREMTAFDRSKQFIPGRYRLSGVSESHRIGHHPKRTWKIQNKTKYRTGDQLERHVTERVRTSPLQGLSAR